MKYSFQCCLWFILLIAISWLAFSDPSYAQSDGSAAREKFFWVNLGIGPSSVGEDGGAFSLSGTYQFGKNTLSFRVLSTGEIFGKSLNEYGLLYGRTLKSSSILISAGAGLAMVEGRISHGILSSKELDNIEPTIGMPVEVQLFWRPASVIGIGLYGFANLNPEESFYGCTLSLQIGKLR